MCCTKCGLKGKITRVRPYQNNGLPYLVCENVSVYCRSGLVNEADPDNWKPEDFQKYVDVSNSKHPKRATSQ